MIIEGRSFNKFGEPCVRMQLGTTRGACGAPCCINCGEGTEAHQAWWINAGDFPGGSSPNDPIEITMTRCEWGRVLLVLRRAKWDGPIATCIKEAVLNEPERCVICDGVGTCTPGEQCSEVEG